MHTHTHTLTYTHTIAGESRLREVFLKTNNDIGGRYYAEMIKVCVCVHGHIDVYRKQSIDCNVLSLERN